MKAGPGRRVVLTSNRFAAARDQWNIIGVALLDGAPTA
jgi:hypothetical protein